MADSTDVPEVGSSRRDVVVVGASAGGVEALTHVVGGLPAGLPAAILVVLHISPEGTSVLPQILNRNGRLRAAHAEDGDDVVPGHIYVAPPDHHLVVEDGRIRTPRGPRENGFRPAIDPLFRSAASAYGPRAVGLILSGGLDDGTLGLRALKAAGGVAAVMDPADAVFPAMPLSAIEHVDVDHVVRLADIPELLASLAGTRVAVRGSGRTMRDGTRLGSDGVEPTLPSEEIPGQPSDLVCPECGGTLWETEVGDLPRFRCRVGHAYGPESLLALHSEALEAGLWAAARTLEERSAILVRLAGNPERRGAGRSAASMRDRAEEARAHARSIREVLEGMPVAIELLEEANGERSRTGTES